MAGSVTLAMVYAARSRAFSLPPSTLRIILMLPLGMEDIRMLGTDVSDLNQVLVIGWSRSGYYAGRERCHIRNKLRNVNSLHDGKERSRTASVAPTLSIAIAKRVFRECSLQEIQQPRSRLENLTRSHEAGSSRILASPRSPHTGFNADPMTALSPTR